MAQHDHDPVLVTGCSTGIGRAVAEELLRQGHTVWATARRPDTLADLADRGAHVTALDVTDEASMAAAVQEVESAHGSVGTLVNNAGYGEYGAVEEVDLDKVRAMFETNVFGLARMCQLVLPGMRRAGRGRIVNIGSMGGRFVFPLGGYYHATKYAVEALTDALRMEVKAFGIDVALVEPGVTRSEFVEKSTDSEGMGGGSGLPLRRDARVGVHVEQRGLLQPDDVGLRRERGPGRGVGRRRRPPADPLPAHARSQGDGRDPRRRR